MADVVKFYPADAAKDPDNVLEQSVGQLQDVLILGYDKDGSLYAASSDGLADGGALLWLLETFRQKLVSGDLSEDAE